MPNIPPVLFVAALVPRLRWLSAAVARHEISAQPIKCREMFRAVLTDAVYDAIASTLPKGAARWPMQRQQGQCFIHVGAVQWSTA